MATKGIAVRGIGELGQDHFKAGCTNNRLSAVPAKPDRCGWDFFVEFGPQVDVSIPLDCQRNLIKALVQVKASESASLSAPDSLPKEPWEGPRTFVARARKVVGCPKSVRFYRLLIAEAERRLELGRPLYETAYRGRKCVLPAYLGSRVAQRRLKSQDAAVLARIMLKLAASDPCIRGLARFLDAAADRLGSRASDHVANCWKALYAYRGPSVGHERP